MKILRTTIQNFRCLDEVTIEFDDVTVLVGANGTGKSTILHALNWFFEGGDLDVEDISGHREEQTVSVRVTFSDLNDVDREALGKYATVEHPTFTRLWSLESGEKLTGHALAYGPFEDVRAHPGARERISAYRDLRNADPDLSLPAERSDEGIQNAMNQWEAEHPDQLEPATVSATHLFGWAGKAKLAGRFDFVLVPAITDPDREVTDARGTLLRQLLERQRAEGEGWQHGIEELEHDIATRLDALIDETGREHLETLSEQVTDQLTELVPDARVRLEPQRPTVQIPDVSVHLLAQDAGLETAVSYQGHGFQRALIIALVQQLSLTQTEGETAGLFLALEEPELYQHPAQARHFAATLDQLVKGASPEAPVQVSYATHSEYFVNPASYEQLRRFGRVESANPWPAVELTSASVDGVVERLDAIFEQDQVPLRVRITMRRKLAEAVFARAVAIVEGPTDEALLRGVADRSGGLDSLGIAVVAASKWDIPIPWAILTELGVPTYVLFDGDGDLRARMEANGRDERDISDAVADNEHWNEVLLERLGGTPEASPATTAQDTYAVFADSLESECQSWEEFLELSQDIAHQLGDWRTKSDDVYRIAAAECGGSPPDSLMTVLERIRALL